jgi:NADPH-ferrihemoprotein reductase
MNPDDEVCRVLQALGRPNERNVPITIRSLDPDVKVKIPTPTTRIALFRHYIELCAPVSLARISSILPSLLLRRKRNDIL